ncbi:hypothetical protein [Streptomyces sp. NPDC046371]|uniref:hypothetical protein n=1 Tax=Streptomyces sp. NPDC046371 TaxID=3154916 RepID=UPI0033C91159
MTMLVSMFGVLGVGREVRRPGADVLRHDALARELLGDPAEVADHVARRTVAAGGDVIADELVGPDAIRRRHVPRRDQDIVSFGVIVR